MRIKHLLIPKDLFGSGLERSTLTRLGPVVVLAGRNGSGKSRILGAVGSLLSHEKPAERAEVIRSQIADRTNNILQINRQLERAPPGPNRRQLSTDLAEQQTGERRASAHLEANGAIILTGDWSHGSVASYMPKNAKLLNYLASSIPKLRNIANNIGVPGGSNTDQWCGPYVRELQQKAFLADAPDVEIDDEERRDARESYSALDDAIQLLLGATIGRDRHGEPTAFGFPLSDGRLSPGQAVLLQLAVALHAQGGKLGTHILLLDEPESHLHPDALLQVLDRLKSVVGEGQLWIATHSVHVLAWAPKDAIWYVDNGRATWAGKNPEIVLNSLLGGDDGRGRLEAFLQLPAQLAISRFAAECLVDPGVVDTGPDDQQLKQIQSAVQKLRRPDRPLRVLDYGAGSGRLLGALQHEHGADRPFSASLDYFSFDPSNEHKPARLALIAEVYGSESAQRDFDAMDKLSSSLDEHSVDLVVMCNVLHEIDPLTWTPLFSKLHGLLRSDGYLLVVEDQQIPVGENAHRYGFLLLDLQHLKKLFAWKEADPAIETTIDRRERLKAHLVPATLLSRVTSTTRVAALNLLRETAMEKIRALRTQEASYIAGQLHGLWVQLLANATFALEDLGNAAQ